MFISCKNPLMHFGTEVICALFLLSPWAEANWFVRTWQSDEGLPDNSVMGIDQTPDGFLWVATQTG